MYKNIQLFYRVYIFIYINEYIIAFFYICKLSSPVGYTF